MGKENHRSLTQTQLPFIGTWLFTMTEPEAFKGTEQTMRVWEKNGVIGASVQIGKFPASEATGIFHDGDMLVLTISHAAKPGIRENGVPDLGSHFPDPRRRLHENRPDAGTKSDDQARHRQEAARMT